MKDSLLRGLFDGLGSAAAGAGAGASIFSRAWSILFVQEERCPGALVATRMLASGSLRTTDRSHSLLTPPRTAAGYQNLHLREVFDWLSGHRPPPSAWDVRNETQLPTPASWHRIGGGDTKQVYQTELRGGVRVVVKRTRSAWNPTSGTGVELLYLTFLRGHLGVPHLLGGYIARDGLLTWVVRDTGGSPIGSVTSDARFTVHSSDAYRELASSRPVELALAILSCFRSFSETGGFFLQDLTPRQFTVSSDDRRVLFELVEGPGAYAGPVARLLETSPVPNGYSGYPKRSVAHCISDAACAPSKSYHCCCAVDAITHALTYDHSGHNHVCEQGTPAGAPEARGLCVRNQLPVRASPAMMGGRQNSSTWNSRRLQSVWGAPALQTAGGGLCSPLSHLTHAYDVATKPWLLPAAAQHSHAVHELLPLMSDPIPARRVSLSQAIARLHAHLRNTGPLQVVTAATGRL